MDNSVLTARRRRILFHAPHPETKSGRVVTFSADFAGKLAIAADPGATVTICGKNMFDPNAVEEGYSLNADGSIVGGYTNARLTGYIPTNGKLTVSAVRIRGNEIRIGLYDANKTFIQRVLSGPDGQGNSVCVINRNNVAYVRVCIFVNSDQFETAQIETGTTKTAFEEYSASTSPVSRIGVNNVLTDSGDVTVTYWTH